MKRVKLHIRLTPVLFSPWMPMRSTHTHVYPAHHRAEITLTEMKRGGIHHNGTGVITSLAKKSHTYTTVNE